MNKNIGIFPILIYKLNSSIEILLQIDIVCVILKERAIKKQ